MGRENRVLGAVRGRALSGGGPSQPPYLLAVRGTQIGNMFKEKRKKPFVGIPKNILEKYKNSIQNISDKEVEEIIDNFLNK